MVNGVLRNLLRQKTKIQIPDHLPKVQKIALQYSHPEWLVDRFIQAYGLTETEEICKANNLPPYHSVRINPLKTTRPEMMKRLKEELGEEAEIRPSLLSDQGIRIKGGGNLAYRSWYKEGYITIQDESSMLVAKVLDPQPAMNVLDVAAAPGGKTTHIAELMKDQGQVIAADLHKHKIQLIEQQQQRLGLHIIKTIHADAREIGRHVGPIFDRILLDVPCSGLGVIRRKPDIKWVKTEKDVKEIVAIQQAILSHASSLLKPGGVMVYSTCTLTPEENQKMIEDFLKNNEWFELDQQLPAYLPEAVNQKLDASNGMVQILPHHFDTDGFFISRLLKKSLKS